LVVSTAAAQTVRDDLATFTKGKATRFATKGNPKAGSVDLNFSYPANWKFESDADPEIVGMFARNDDHADYRLGLWISEADSSLIFTSPEEMEDFVKSKDFNSKFVPDGATLNSKTVMRFNDRPAGLIDCTQLVPVPGGQARVRMLALMFLADTHVVLLTGTVAVAPGDYVHLDRKFEEAKPLFMAVINGATLNNPPSFSSKLTASKGAVKLIVWLVIIAITAVGGWIGKSLKAKRNAESRDLAYVPASNWQNLSPDSADPAFQNIQVGPLPASASAAPNWPGNIGPPVAAPYGTAPAAPTSAAPTSAGYPSAGYPVAAPSHGMPPVQPGSVIPQVRPGTPAPNPPVAASAAKPVLPAVKRLPPPMPPKKPKPPGSA
jgi:hypothetical protein